MNGQSALDSTWDVVVTPHHILNTGARELWRYRDLIALLARRNFVVNYRQTVLGPLWHILQPLTTTAAFTIVFSRIAHMPTDEITPFLFYMSGLVIWSNFSLNVSTTADVFIANAAIFSKVYFPRLVVPIATVFTNCFSLGLNVFVFATVLAAAIHAGHAPLPSIWLILAPLLFIANATIALGVGLLFSAITTRYRDMMQVLGFVLQVWMYASPVIYPLSQIPEKWRTLAAFNPVATTIELFRQMLFGSGSVSALQIAVSAIVATTILVGALVLFKRSAMRATDTV
jgi:lipopolysaccharide transport system permease protein